MATPISLTSILKVIQEDGTDPMDLVRKSTLGKTISHKKDFQGAEIKWSVPYAGLAGGSFTATTAEANDQNGRYALFTTGQARSYYQKRAVSGQLTRQALKGDVSTEYVDYLKAEIKLGTGAVATRLWNAAYRSNTSSVGVVAAFTTTTVTLATLSDVFYMFIGDRPLFSATDGAAVRTTTASPAGQITGVNTSTGVLTGPGSTTTAAIAIGDYITIDGNLNLQWHGLQSYNPIVAPTGGDAVFGSGVDRSIEPEMLAGVRFDTTNYQLDSCLIRLMAVMNNRPGFDFNSVKIYLNPLDMGNLKISKEGSRVIDSDNEYNYGVEGFKVGGALVVEDPFAPEGRGQLVADGCFELHSNDGIQLDMVDGNQIRKAAGDTYTLMVLLDGDFTSPKPYGLANFAWPSA